jgi:hypothetical protein
LHRFLGLTFSEYSALLYSDEEKHMPSYHRLTAILISKLSTHFIAPLRSMLNT